MRKDKFEPNLDNEKRNNETNISLDVNMDNKIKNGRE